MAKTIKILVLDDEPGILESFKMILGIKNYEVNTFERGIDAINSIEKGEKYDVCFLDQNLTKDDHPYAGMNGGIEVLKKIKEIDPDTEVVIITAYYQTNNMSLNAITLGAMEYLGKPFMMEIIYELVDRAIRRRRDRRSKKEDSGPIGPIH